MKKKLLALVLIMVVAIGTIFAADINGDATALLKGYIPSEFQHGFTVEGIKYQSSYTVPGDVFALQSGVVELPYGYRVNSSDKFKAHMVVGPFEHELNTGIKIPIAEIQIGTGQVENTAIDGNLVIDYTGGEAGSFVEEAITIKVFIPDTTGKETGHYTATITISVESYD